MNCGKNKNSNKKVAGPPAGLSFNTLRKGGLGSVSKLSSNDDSGQNPSGRPQSDVRKWKTRGKVLRIVAWNVRTLFKAGNYDNLFLDMEDMKLDILGISGLDW